MHAWSHIYVHSYVASGAETVYLIATPYLNILSPFMQYPGAYRGGFPGVSGNPFWISLLQVLVKLFISYT